MNFSGLIQLRQSVRRYAPIPVENEKILQCLDAARLAPSASNSQPWHFIVVDNPELKNQVAKATFSNMVSFNHFTVQAPIIVALVIEKPGMITQLAQSLKKHNFSLVDSGIAASHFCLQAAELGLGTCMLGWFNQQEVKELLHIPKGNFVSLLITLGYPPEDYRLRQKTRKPLTEITGWNGYGKQISRLKST